MEWRGWRYKEKGRSEERGGSNLQVEEG